MSERGADWQIRSIARDRIVENFLATHHGYLFGGMTKAAAWHEVEACLDCWLELGLGVTVAPSGEQLFDPVEVLNFMVAAGRRGEDSFWQQNYVASGRASYLSQFVRPNDGEPPPPAGLASRKFRVRLKRVYNVKGASAGDRLRLRLPLPIEDEAIRHLEVTCDTPPGATFTIEPARLDAIFPVKDRETLSLGMTATFDAYPDTGAAAAMSEEDRALYLRPREQLITVDEHVASLARTAAAGRADDWSRANAAYDYLIDTFALGGVPYDALDPAQPASWSLETGFLDCQICSALFCAMCRSLGVPARLVSGYQLYSRNGGYHYWAQAWIAERGWVSFDSLGWQLSLAGRDPKWRRLFVGATDFRLKVQVLPLLFTGPSWARLSRPWRLVSRRLPDGHETSFLDAISGELIYRDELYLLET